jgi:hypothetical protein
MERQWKKETEERYFKKDGEKENMRRINEIAMRKRAEEEEKIRR